jgi:phosphatidylglycerophosphatase A
MRPAPGTWGSVVGVLLFLLFVQIAPPLSIEYAVVTVLGTVIGCYLCGRTAKDVGVHDHSAIVWDEIAGVFITLAWLPASSLNVVAGFVLFRLFDIVKPWPIRWLDKQVQRGVGIMLDDVVAGLFAAVCLWLVQPVLAGLSI